MIETGLIQHFIKDVRDIKEKQTKTIMITEFKTLHMNIKPKYLIGLL